MEEHYKKRPPKKIYSDELVAQLRQEAINKLKLGLLPDKGILKIILIGSSVKGSFGEYSPPGFRASLFSDFDFIVFVDEKYKIPKWLNKEPSGKPFPDKKLNLAYRNKCFVKDKYDLDVFFLRQDDFNNPLVQKQGELAGIPMTDDTKNVFLEIYNKFYNIDFPC